MHTHPAITAAPAGRPATRRPASPSRRVVDAPTRMVHALIAIGFAGAYLSAESERWRALHVTLGYTLAGLLVFRLLYGLAGPRQARAVLWFRRLAGAPAWLRDTATALRQARLRDVPWRQGQNLLMATAVAALPLILAPLLLSGLAAHLEWLGRGLADAVSEFHEALGEGALAAVLVHVGLVIGLSLLRRRNQAAPMITGRVDGAGPDLARRNLGALALLVLAATIGFVAWQWQQSPQGLVPPASAAAGPDQGTPDDHDD
ncbi:MAG: cytochrome b/b6 domain-containing protein [Rubrivivax sp.]|jgi:cytochrome b|nr:cytochrome b/b6 domain-containing protein [Rubrivivax sp.]